MKRVKKVLFCLLVVAMVFSIFSCGENKIKDDDTNITYEQTFENGQTEFTFKVVNKEQVTTYFLVKTDKKTVGDALIEAGLINGEYSTYGLYVKEVNKEVLSWDEDQMYWAFYIDGDYAPTSVDLTDVEAGKEYAFVASK